MSPRLAAAADAARRRSSGPSGASGRTRQRERMVGSRRPGSDARQDEHSARRRLFERLQQRVGSVRIEIVGGIDDDDAPGVLRGRMTEESCAGAAPRRSGMDVAEPLRRRIPYAGAGRAGPDGTTPAPDGRRCCRRRHRGLLSGAVRSLGSRQQEARQTIGERRLADAHRVPRSARRDACVPLAKASTSARSAARMAEDRLAFRADAGKPSSRSTSGRASVSVTAGARAISAPCRTEQAAEAAKHRLANALLNGVRRAGGVDHAAARRDRTPATSR